MAGVHHVQGAVGDGLDRVVHGGARARRHEVLRLAVQLEAPSAANRLIGEVVQSRRRPLLGPSPG